MHTHMGTHHPVNGGRPEGHRRDPLLQSCNSESGPISASSATDSLVSGNIHLLLIFFNAFKRISDKVLDLT